MKILPVSPEQRSKIDAFIVQQWYSLQMVVHGESIDLGTADGWYASESDEIIGLLTYRIVDDEMEILSLDSLQEHQGIGTALLQKAVAKAKDSLCSRIWLITTNDNLQALRFYQKREFELVCIYRNAVDEARKKKPSIPFLGMDGIPLKHEMELQMLLL